MLLRNAVTLVCGALVLSTLPAAAVAADEPPVDAADQLTAVQPPNVARGLIVMTDGSVSDTTLLKAADRAAPASIDVADVATLSKEVSTVTFDEVVSADAADDLAAEVAERPDVVWAVPDRRVRASAVSPVRPNDPLFDQQYQVWDKRDFSGAPAGGYSTKAPSLWPATQGKSRVVAVLDTGVRKEHPDLAGQLVAGYDMISSWYSSNDGNGRDSDPSDPGDWLVTNDSCYGYEGGPAQSSSWHGTHVAGSIAARANNKIGIAGVAPTAKIQPVRVLGKCGGWDSDVLAGITWASGGTVPGVPKNKTPAKVINMSLGVTYETAAERNTQCSAYQSVIAQARARGSVVVVAAGNDLGNANLAVPSSCAGAFSVGATSDIGQQAFYSNEGTSVDISAPGGDSVVKGTDGAVGTQILSTSNSGTRGPASSVYRQEMGTSMAAPAVSGAAALLMSLGVTSPNAVEAMLKAAVMPFPSRSNFSNVVITGGGQTYNLNLNCTPTTCGAGLLDLSKVPAPIGQTRIAGTLAVGQTLTGIGGWTGSVPLARQWFRSGAAIPGATGTTYTLTAADLGRRISLRVAPASGPFVAISSTSVSTVTIGLNIAASGFPTSTTYGQSKTVKVSVSDASGGRNGLVRIMRGSTEIGRANAVNGKASVSISGIKWTAGTNAIRAEFTSGQDLARTATRNVSVKKAKVKSVKRTIKSKLSRKKRETITVRVSVSGVKNPTGRVWIYDGRKKIAKATLGSSSRGVKKIRLPKLKKGTHKIRVQYVGTSNIYGKYSSYRKVKVK